MMNARARRGCLRLMELCLNTSPADKMLGQLESLSEHLPADAQTHAWYRCYKKAYEFAAA